ncbi:unnamed protein product, partial [Urochloa humidicola]
TLRSPASHLPCPRRSRLTGRAAPRRPLVLLTPALSPLAVHHREGPRRSRFFVVAGAGSLPYLHPRLLPLELRSLDVPTTAAVSSAPLLRRRYRRPSPPPQSFCPPHRRRHSFSVFSSTCDGPVLPASAPSAPLFPVPQNLHEVRKEMTFIWMHSLWPSPAGKKREVEALLQSQDTALKEPKHEKEMNPIRRFLFHQNLLEMPVKKMKAWGFCKVVAAWWTA